MIWINHFRANHKEITLGLPSRLRRALKVKYSNVLPNKLKFTIISKNKRESTKIKTLQTPRLAMSFSSLKSIKVSSAGTDLFKTPIRWHQISMSATSSSLRRNKRQSMMNYTRSIKLGRKALRLISSASKSFSSLARIRLMRFLMFLTVTTMERYHGARSISQHLPMSWWKYSSHSSLSLSKFRSH